MLSYIDIANFAIAVSGLTVAAVGFGLSILTPFKTKKDRGFFITLFLVMIAFIISDLVSQVSLSLYGPTYVTLSKTAVYLESLFSFLLIPLLTYFIFTCAHESPHKKKVQLHMGIFSVIYLILLTSTWFNESIYKITVENIYVRGPLYPVLLIPPVAAMLFNLGLIIFMRKRFSLRVRRSLFEFVLIPMVCMIIQMFSYGLLLSVLGSSLAGLLLVLHTGIYQSEAAAEQKADNAHQHANILALQMQPHFIYNTLTSIYYMCAKDTKQAQQAILDFTLFLRKNINAIKSSSPIPFKDELDHVKAYVSIEQTRFKEKLVVHYDDIKETDFLLPPLTLQPLVENSIKHGVSPNLDPLHIHISTEKNDKGYVVTVADTGIGLAASINAGKPGTGIAMGNIKERLKMMSDGYMEVDPDVKSGTTVRVFIPEEKAQPQEEALWGAGS